MEYPEKQTGNKKWRDYIDSIDYQNKYATSQNHIKKATNEGTGDSYEDGAPDFTDKISLK